MKWRTTKNSKFGGISPGQVGTASVYLCIKAVAKSDLGSRHRAETAVMSLLTGALTQRGKTGVAVVISRSGSSPNKIVQPMG